MSMNGLMLFQLINLMVSLCILGALVYGYVLFVKAARRVIAAADLYIQKERNPETDRGLEG